MWWIDNYLFCLPNLFAACMLWLCMQRPKSLCRDERALGASIRIWRPTSCPNPPNPWHEVFGLPGRNCHQWRSAAHEEKAKRKASPDISFPQASPFLLNTQQHVHTNHLPRLNSNGSLGFTSKHFRKNEAGSNGLLKDLDFLTHWTTTKLGMPFPIS